MQVPHHQECSATSFTELATTLGLALKARGLKLTLAESCTGGMVAQAITAVAGSSAWFDCGFVTYSNEAKQKILNVSAQTLLNFGAVSEETAIEMAIGALQTSATEFSASECSLGKNKQCTIAASITGIAGPDGGTETKPIGTVCFAFADNRPEKPHTISSTQHFTGNRESIRSQSTEYALKALLRLTLSIEI